jgi:hypothetical protein
MGAGGEFWRENLRRVLKERAAERENMQRAVTVREQSSSVVAGGV